MSVQSSRGAVYLSQKMVVLNGCLSLTVTLPNEMTPPPTSKPTKGLHDLPSSQSKYSEKKCLF